MLYPTELQAQNQGQQPLRRQNGWWENGRGREIRTPDILLPKQARYQTALYPDKDFRPAISASLRGRILLTDLLSVNLESAALSVALSMPFSAAFLSSAKLPPFFVMLS